MVTLDFKNLWYIYKKPMLNIDIYRFRYKDEKKKSHSITNQTKVKAAILLSTVFVVVVQSLSCVQVIVTPWTAAHQASLSFTISRCLLKLVSIESVMPSNHLILCCPLLLLPSVFHSIRVFFNELALRIKWPKYWSSSFSINPSNEYSGLISFQIDWFDLLAFYIYLKEAAGIQV